MNEQNESNGQNDLSEITEMADITDSSGMTEMADITDLSGMTEIAGITGLSGMTEIAGITGLSGKAELAEPLFPLLSIVRLRMGSDGRGVTSLVAGAGCKLDCHWCINRRVLREIKAEMVSPARLLEMVMIDDLYFQATGGGVTFGGGESLLHAAFIKRFREICPAAWRICAETSLYVEKELISLSLQSVDDYIVDCKDLDRDRYHRYTGGDADLFHENLSFLLHEAGPDRIHVRVPYIPEYNTKLDQENNARILKDMGFTRIETFNYVKTILASKRK